MRLKDLINNRKKALLGPKQRDYKGNFVEKFLRTFLFKNNLF